MRRALLAAFCIGLLLSGCTSNSITDTASSPIPEGSYEGTLTMRTWTSVWGTIDETTDSGSYVAMFDGRGIPLSSLGGELRVGYTQPMDLLGVITGTYTVTGINANNSGLVITYSALGQLPDGTQMTGTEQDIYTLRSDGTVSYSCSGSLHTDDAGLVFAFSGDAILSRR